jgi:hypothetical protein
MQKPHQLVALKAGEPGPQTNEGRLSLLRLEANKAIDGAKSRDPLSGKQHLPGEQGPIERTGA